MALVGFSLFLSVFMFLMLDYIYAGKSESFAKTWLKAEDSNIRIGNLLQSVSKYQKIMFASDFLQGVSIFDTGLTPLVEFGDPILKPEKFIRGSDDISILRGGFFNYYAFYHFPKNENIFIVFHFYDWTASLVYAVIIIVILLSFLIILAFIIIEHRNHYNTISRTILLTIQQVSHDFRAPFAIINKVLNYIRNDESLNYTEKLKDYEDQISMSFGVVNGLIEDMLTGNKKENLKVDLVDIEKLVRDLLDTHFDSVPHVSFKISVKGKKDFYGDYNKILRILYNLLSNAVSHCEKLVWIEIDYGDAHFKISIINDGIPIKKEQVGNLFLPFQSFREGGTGLGLFICRQLVEAHGGQIWCEPVSVGTQFHIILDYKSPTSRPDSSDEQKKQIENNILPESSRPSTHKLPPTSQQEDPLENDVSKYFDQMPLSIVAIDDQQFYQKNLTESLRHPNIEISVFNHTDDFLMHLRSADKNPDLIIVDRFGPGFDVQENKFADSCRDFGYQGPIILYSNSVGDSYKSDPKEFFMVLSKSEDFSLKLLARIMDDYKKSES